MMHQNNSLSAAAATSSKKALLACGAVVLFLVSIPSSFAFVTQASVSPNLSSSTSLSAASRRDAVRGLLLGGGSIAAGWIGGIAMPEEASASYTAYTQREQDWEARKKSGDIQISTARDLKAQLREIAPMNEKSMIFCPNGSSAAVTPMMENRCSDRLAAPSVYGRTEDTVGNSIPGFQKGSGVGSSLSVGSLSSETGGFPKY